MKNVFLSAVVVCTSAVASMTSTALAQNRVGARPLVVYETNNVKSQKQVDEDNLASYMDHFIANEKYATKLEHDFEVESAELAVYRDELVKLKQAFAQGKVQDITVEELNDTIDQCNDAIRRQQDNANMIDQLNATNRKRGEALIKMITNYQARYGQSQWQSFERKLAVKWTAAYNQ